MLYYHGEHIRSYLFSLTPIRFKSTKTKKHIYTTIIEQNKEFGGKKNFKVLGLPRCEIPVHIRLYQWDVLKPPLQGLLKFEDWIPAVGIGGSTCREMFLESWRFAVVSMACSGGSVASFLLLISLFWKVYPRSVL